MADIRIEGVAEVLASIDRMGDTSEIEMAIGKACALIERAAKEKAPKGTGELRRSITSEVKTTGEDVIGVVYTPLEYAPYVEYGTGLFAENGGRQDVPWHYKDDKGEWHTTSGQHPQPFMRPAVNENRERVIQIIKEGISND